MFDAITNYFSNLTPEHYFFFLFAIVAIASALEVVMQRSPLYSAVALIFTMAALAANFVLLKAQFLAAIQIIVYAGAIIVLFVFVIMLLNVREEESRTDRQRYLKWLAVPLFLALLAEVAIVIRYVNTVAPAIPNPNAIADPSQSLGTVESIAHGMFTDYVLPFEATSVLILMAIVGAMYLARRERKEDLDRMEQALASEEAEIEQAHHHADKSHKDVAA